LISEDLTTEATWTARSVRPVTALYVVAVFVGSMALAHFVFHSPDAVKALALACTGAVVPLMANILGRTEYRLSEAGLEKRRVQSKEPREFKTLFRWDELSHLTPTGTGYKFYKEIRSSSRLSRFLKLHLSTGFSGEFHVEDGERDRILAVIQQKGIPFSRPTETLARRVP
jgi:hypothetical protein